MIQGILLQGLSKFNEAQDSYLDCLEIETVPYSDKLKKVCLQQLLELQTIFKNKDEIFHEKTFFILQERVI